MRKPTIKIYTEDLLVILHSHFGGPASAQAINDIVNKSIESRDFLKHRLSITAPTKSKAKAVKKGTEIDAESVNLFNRLLLMERQSRQHVGVRLYDEGSSDFKILLGIVELAEQYYTEMFKGGNRQDAYQSYIATGLNLMGKKYGLNKYKFFNQSIFDARTGELLVASDDCPVITEYMINGYKHHVKKITGVDCIVLASELENFVHARRQAAENKCDYKHWIKAQFGQLEFMNITPTPSQFHGEKALMRYRNHIVTVAREDHNIQEGWTDAQWINYIQQGA